MAWGHAEIEHNLWNISVASGQSMGPVARTGNVVQIVSSARPWESCSKGLAELSCAQRLCFTKFLHTLKHFENLAGNLTGQRVALCVERNS